MRAIALKENAVTQLDKIYSVQLGKPLEKFSTDLIQAHIVKTETTEYLGLISHPTLPPRHTVLEKLSHSNMQMLMRPLKYFPVLLPGEKRYRILVITVKPKGVPLPLTKDGRGVKYREESITELIIKPFVRLLRDFDSKGISYRSLRPDNLYFFQNHLTFGECYMLPPGYKQPKPYEPVESSLCDSEARGAGTVSHDIFSLGMVVLSMAIGKDFSQVKNLEILQEQRLISNSLSAFLGEYRLSERLTELLKGTLNDDTRQRWTLNDVDDWAAGQKVPLRHNQAARRATRPFFYQKKDHVSVAQLVNAIGTNVTDNNKDTLSILASKDMENWLVRSNNQKTAYTDLRDGINRSKRSPTSIQQNVTTTFALSGIDHHMPIYYQKKVIATDGICDALAAHQHDAVSRMIPFDLILSHFMEFRIHLVRRSSNNLSNFIILQKIYEKLSLIANKTAYGMGFERCLYELNKTLPCQSPLFEKYLVRNPAELLDALEEIAKVESNHKLWPIDRHIAAFLVSHTNKIKDVTLYNLTAHENKAKVALANVQILGMLENAYSNKADYPYLCKWLLKVSAPMIGLYHSKTRQNLVRNQLDKLKKKASLIQIHNIVDQPIELAKDSEEFGRAQNVYQNLEKKKEQLLGEMEQLPIISRRISDQYAPYVSGGLAGLLTLGLIALR